MLRNALALITGAILLVIGFMFSLVILAVVFVIGLAVWGYFWWKTRKLRQALREEAMRCPPSDGHIVEGEAIVVDEFHASMTPSLPERTPPDDHAR